MVSTKGAIVKSFVIDRRDAMLSFPAESEFFGAEIRAKLDVDVRTFLELQTIGDSSSPSELKDAFTTFGDRIVKEWNLEDEDGKAVPASGEGFLSCPPSFCIAVITAWASQAGGVGEV